MSINRSAATPVILPPGGGETLSVPDISVTVKVAGRQSGGQFAVFEATEMPGSGSPTQWHKETTVILHVLEGTLTLRIGEETFLLAPGSCAYVPPGTIYSFANQDNAPMRYLLVHSPAWIEDYIAEAIELLKNEPTWPPADLSKFFAARAKYDVHEPPVK